MSLQERTLVVKNFDPEKTTSRLLKELCLQAGPIRNVVLKPDHAFVEYEDVVSVGYSKALLDGIICHGRKLIMEPKIRTNENFRYTQALQDYIKFDKNQRLVQQQQQQQLLQQQQAAQYYQHLQQPPSQFQPALQANYGPAAAPPPQFPISQYPVNFMPTNQMPDPQIFNNNGNNYFQPNQGGQYNSMFDLHNQQHQLPSSSSSSSSMTNFKNHGGSNLERSRSFNTNRTNNHRQQSNYRPSDWARRK